METDFQTARLKAQNTEEVAFQLRLRRSLMATGAGLATILVLVLAWYLGYVYWSPLELLLFILVSAAGYLLFPWLVVSKRNLRFDLASRYWLLCDVRRTGNPQPVDH